MPESFGARMRQRREERNIALSTIAEQTKIKLSLLEALERDDLSRWPAGIYRRAYIRAYGQAIGLSAETIAREFLEAHPDPVESILTADAIESAGGGRPNGAPPIRLRNIVGAAIASLSRRRRNAGEESDRLALPEAIVDAAQVVAEPGPAPSVEHGHIEEPAASDRDGAAPADAPATDSTHNETPLIAPDLVTVARLCTGFAQVENADDVHSLLQETATLLDATGLIVWAWDSVAEELIPALVHGYSEKTIAQLPAVKRDDDNATAEAFRLRRPCLVEGGETTPGALVVPLLTPGGCAGVLALELQHGAEKTAAVAAIATILAALLAQLMGGRAHAARPENNLSPAPNGDVAVPVLRVLG